MRCEIILVKLLFLKKQSGLVAFEESVDNGSSSPSEMTVMAKQSGENI